MNKRRVTGDFDDDDDRDDFSLDELSDAELENAHQSARETAVMLSARAVRELSEILHNSKNSAQARVAAGNGVLRAAGLFGRTNDDPGKKEVHQMTPDEIARSIDALERVSEERSRAQANNAKAKSDIFD